VITAIVLAYEIFCRLSDQVHVGELGWDQGTFGVVGATCAAGKVLGLSREHMAQAISLAIVPNLPLGATRVGELPMWKGCAAASATRAGIFAAQLAQQGMTGPAEPFDGRRGLWEQAVGAPVSITPWKGDGTPWRIMATHFKRFPSQIHTQGPISLALDLRPRVTLAEIAALHISTYAMPCAVQRQNRRNGLRRRGKRRITVFPIWSPWPSTMARSLQAVLLRTACVTRRCAPSWT
jgi:2-methylcitrate dehydratase